MCSPKGYSEIGFGPLTKYSAKEMHQQIVDAGLYCKSSHFGHWELQGDNANTTIEFANKLELNDIVISSSYGVDATLDDWKKLADEINKSGELVKIAGMQLAYHNGTMGPVLEGIPLYDHLMKLFDPELVKMQLQIADIDRYDMVEYLTKYKGRYTSVHLLDWDPEINWVTAIGHGMINWKKLLTAVAKSGISEYGLIIELDCKNPLEALQKSYAYLTNS
jgi:sugar phosphate isomerase/epimerase